MILSVRPVAASLFLVALLCSGLVACGDSEPPASGVPDAAPPADSSASGAAGVPAQVSDWRDEFDTMVNVLDLQGAERSELEARFIAREQELHDWFTGADGRRLLQLEDELREATAARNLHRVRAITDEAAPLRNHITRLIESSLEAVHASLSPDQRTVWDTYLLFMRLYELMEPLGLSGEQNEQLSQGAFDFLRRAREAGEPNPEAAAFLEYERWAVRSVLDPGQRARYEDIQRANPLRSLR